MKQQKISLLIAILININIVVGGAFFINAPLIAQKAGMLAPLAWFGVGLLLLPLVLVLSSLSGAFPVAGGLYVYSEKLLSPFWGFVSGWGYFIGTAAGNALIFDAFGKLATKLGFMRPLTETFGLGNFGIDLVLILIFSALNLFNIEFLSKTQVIFTTLKTIPFFALLLGGIFLFNPTNFSAINSTDLTGFFNSIPIVLFAYIGIEACCAIGHVIDDARTNASRAIMISFFLIVSTYALAQLCIVAINGTSAIDAFTSILPRLTSNQWIIFYGNKLIELCILSSFLGGFYSMFYANNWNLYAIAQEGAIHGAKPLAQLNRFQSPWVSLLFQALIIIGFLLLSRNIEILSTMSDFGIVIAYLLSGLAYLALPQKNNGKKWAIGGLALVGCGYLLIKCTNDLLEAGVKFFLPFLALLMIGVLSYLFKKQKLSD